MNNPSGHEIDECTSKWCKIVSEKKEYGWSLPTDMAEYANENSEKFIPDKKCERSNLVEVAEARKLKSWMIFYCSYLSKRKKTVHITIDSTFEKIQDKVIAIMSPLSKLPIMIENPNSVKGGNAAVVQMDTVLELLERSVVLIGQCSNTITYGWRKNVLLGVTGISTTQVAAILKEKASFLQKHDKALFFERSLLIIWQRLLKPKNSQ